MLDLDALIGGWYRGRKNRFETANPREQVYNPLDEPGAIIQDMIGRNPRPIIVQTLDLTVANQIEILVPGFHVVIYGFQQGSAIKAVNTQAYVECFVGDYKAGDAGFPLKHARGLTSPYQKLTLKWPAQANMSADLVLHTSMYRPWIDGEACT